jgi:hypothetical protein
MDDRYRTSLEVSKKLKEAGFPQDGCDGYWFKQIDGFNLVNYKPRSKELEHYAAPCTGRLGDELPLRYSTIKIFNDQYTIAHTTENKNKLIEFNNEKEADARALMWIELKERGVSWMIVLCVRI